MHDDYQIYCFKCFAATGCFSPKPYCWTTLGPTTRLPAAWWCWSNRDESDRIKPVSVNSSSSDFMQRKENVQENYWKLLLSTRQTDFHKSRTAHIPAPMLEAGKMPSSSSLYQQTPISYRLLGWPRSATVVGCWWMEPRKQKLPARPRTISSPGAAPECCPVDPAVA